MTHLRIILLLLLLSSCKNKTEENKPIVVHLEQASDLQQATNLQETSDSQQASNLQETPDSQQTTNLQETPDSQQTTNLQETPDSQQTTIIENTYSYHYQTPNETFVLNRALSEISGLSFHAGGNALLAHNDENGIFYTLDITTGAIREENKFGKRGDYEGIEYVGNHIIIAKHNGDLHLYNEDNGEVEILKNKLTAKNDVEGLCYDKDKDALLIACKGQSLTEEKHKKEKCVYVYDLQSKTLNEAPFLTIKDKVLAAWVKENYTEETKTGLKKKVHRVKEFAPSGIAIHPETGDYFLLSARGSLLVIIDKNTKLKEITFLNNKSIPQPEGICFDKENNLYISTEGQGFSGKIFKFKYNG